MEKTKNNIIWNFFKSVKLALFTLFILAFTSIIGTIIPQNEPPDFYIRQYGANTAKLFQMLGIPDMYNTWWFLLLLVLLSINLIICSLNRFPDAWRLVVMDNLDVSPDRLRKMRLQYSSTVKNSASGAASFAEKMLLAAGWKPKKTDEDGNILFFAQKGAWTRLGVYGVHLSILVIFIGAIIGSLFGYKASVMLPEQAVTDRVFERGSGRAIPLDFSVRCDSFTLSYYDNGAPKEYVSELTVLENGKEVLSMPIEVNDPLHYKGITFYQSSYNGFDEYLITLQDQKTKAKRKFHVRPGQKITWPGTDVSFGIINHRSPDRWGQYRLKIWFSDGKVVPSQFWLDGSTAVSVERPDTTYLISSKQFFATGLQVARDPGVWYVYAGCTLMLLGMLIVFSLSHKRIWVYVTTEGNNAGLLVCGTSNKNKAGFEMEFEKLVKRFRQHSEKSSL